MSMPPLEETPLPAGNSIVQCPNCGAELSIELAQEAAQEHGEEAMEPESLRDTITKAMGP